MRTMSEPIGGDASTSPRTRGRFVTFEGGEGAGKSTVLAAIAALLDRHQVRHRMTREPGGTPVGEALRALVLDPKLHGITAETETLMMFAARAQHVADVIEPALASGLWVISDRYTDASYAYQGGGRGVALDMLRALEACATRGLVPDLTFLLDVPVEEGMKRVAGRGTSDRMESETVAFFERVRAAYLERAKAEPARFRVIEATRPLAEVVGRVESELARFIEAQAVSPSRGDSAPIAQSSDAAPR
jgi:dTMP kinase